MDFFRDIVMVAASQGGGAAPVAGYAAWPSLIGAEMMVNGDCSSGTGWTLPAGVVIAAGKQTWTAVSLGGVENSGTAGASLIDGVAYRCAATYDSISGGALYMTVGTTAGTPRSTAGTFSEDIIAGNPAEEGGWSTLRNSGTVTAQLDNFSVKSVGLLGVEADWSLVSVNWASVEPTGIAFAGDPSATASLTGSAATAFDAAVSNSTACTVTITVVAYSTGTAEIRMKGGSWVDMVTNGDGQFAKAITSGAGSGFDVRSTAGAELQIIHIQIALV